MLNKQILPVIYSLPIGQITPEIIGYVITGKREYSPRSKNAVISVIRNVCDYAASEGVPDNINWSELLYLGYISDGEVRPLMKHCKAFLFPSICEGFGMHFIEALASRARIIIASASCLPESCRDSAYYIDLYDYDVDLDRLLEEVAPPQNVLERFGWDKSAKKIHELAKRLTRS